MQLHLNFEAPSRWTTMQVASMLHDRLMARTVKLRAHAVGEIPLLWVATVDGIALPPQVALTTVKEMLVDLGTPYATVRLGGVLFRVTQSAYAPVPVSTPFVEYRL